MAVERAKKLVSEGKKEDEAKQLLLDAEFSEEEVKNTLVLLATALTSATRPSTTR